MRVLGFSPSSGNLPESRSITALASSITTPRSRRSRSSRTGIDPRRSSMATMTRSMRVFGLHKGAKVCRKAFAIPVECTLALSVDNFHAGIASGAQSFGNGARPLAATQHIDAFAEHRKANDPLICRSPDNENYGENRGADEKNIGSHVYFRDKIQKCRENKR